MMPRRRGRTFSAPSRDATKSTHCERCPSRKLFAMITLAPEIEWISVSKPQLSPLLRVAFFPQRWPKMLVWCLKFCGATTRCFVWRGVSEQYPTPWVALPGDQSELA